jgi:hypothetical protein
MKAIYTARTQAMKDSGESVGSFWVSIDDASWLPVGEPDRPLEADDYAQVADLFARHERERDGKKTITFPITFARRFLSFFDQKPVFFEPILVEADEVTDDQT